MVFALFQSHNFEATNERGLSQTARIGLLTIHTLQNQIKHRKSRFEQNLIMAEITLTFQSYSEFVERQESIIQQMKAIAEEVKKINAKSGEDILAALATVSLNAMGVPLKLPSFLGYAVLPFPLNIILTARKQSQLKTQFEKLAVLQKQFNDNAVLYNKLQTTEVSKKAIEESYNTLFGGNDSVDGVSQNGGSKVGGSNDVSRSANLLTNTNLIILLVVLVALFFLFKSKNK